jgi:hypothetical protein
MVERRGQFVDSPDPRRLGMQWFLDVLVSAANKSLKRLSNKSRAATSSPWFALICAGCCFAALLVFTGALAGMALTKQPGRTDMIAGPRIGGITSREKSPPIERNFDSDLIAILIDLTAREEARRKHSAPPAVPSGPPRILLDARSFATVPLNDRRTDGYSD